VAELQVLVGAWQAFPTFSIFAGIGILVGVAYTLRAMQKAFFGERGAATRWEEDSVQTISIPERLGAAVLISATLLIGLYPRLLLDLIIPSFRSPLFDGLRKGGGL
jgi:NADH-quinone oxidoreductase subunit M